MSKTLSKFAAAAAIYTGFAVYLYQPHFKNFNKLQYLLIINTCLASLGCYLLSRRWVWAFVGSFFAGAIYGFGPFVLGLAGYHPTAGFLAATVPWLFLPAAFWPRLNRRWVSWPLSALPFLAILLFFQVSAHYRLFAIPIQAGLHLADLAGLLAVLVRAEQSLTLVGFYHVPIAALVMGLSMLAAARRFGIVIVFAVGTAMAFCGSVFGVSPVIWLTIPLLCCSVLIGAGMQGLILAGSADRKWLLATVMIMATLSIVTLLLAAMADLRFSIFGLQVATYDLQLSIGKSWQLKTANLFVVTAAMYILGTIAVTIVFFMARAKLRIHWLRLVVLCPAMAVDIFFGARFIVDKVF